MTPVLIKKKNNKEPMLKILSNSLLMREPGRCYNQFKGEIKEQTHL